MNDLLIKRVLKELPYNERLMLYRILHTDVPDTINHVIEKSILEYGLNLGKESVIIQYLDSYNNRSINSSYNDIIQLIEDKYGI